MIMLAIFLLGIAAAVNAQCGGHTVVSGDTFWYIAGQNAAQTCAWLAANPGVNPCDLQPGQCLNAPTAYYSPAVTCNLSAYACFSSYVTTGYVAPAPTYYAAAPAPTYYAAAPAPTYYAAAPAPTYYAAAPAPTYYAPAPAPAPTYYAPPTYVAAAPTYYAAPTTGYVATGGCASSVLLPIGSSIYALCTQYCPNVNANSCSSATMAASGITNPNALQPNTPICISCSGYGK